MFFNDFGIQAGAMISLFFQVFFEKNNGSRAAPRQVANMDPKNMWFRSAYNVENWDRVLARARFSGFHPFQKKIDFGLALDIHFGAFGSSMRRKQSF